VAVTGAVVDRTGAKPAFGRRRALDKRLHRLEWGSTTSKGAETSKAEATALHLVRSRAVDLAGSRLGHESSSFGYEGHLRKTYVLFAQTKSGTGHFRTTSWQMKTILLQSLSYF
jgi:hypothetical protein